MKQAQELNPLDFFRDIDELLAGENLAQKIPLYLFGGAAAVIAYGSRRGTLDIDAYIEDRAVKAKLLRWAGRESDLQKKHGLYLHDANTDLMLIETPDWKERSVEIFSDKLKHIKLMALGKEDLILSKLSRYSNHDREDIKFIAEKYKISAEKLIAYYRSAQLYFVGNLKTIDATFNIVLAEHFGLKPRSLRTE